MVFTARHATGPGGRTALQADLATLRITFKNSRPCHPQTCGKVERFHQTLKKWVRAQPAQPSTIAEIQAQLHAFAEYYNTVRPHRSCGRKPPEHAYRARPLARPGACVPTTATSSPPSRFWQSPLTRPTVTPRGLTLPSTTNEDEAARAIRATMSWSGTSLIQETAFPSSGPRQADDPHTRGYSSRQPTPRSNWSKCGKECPVLGKSGRLINVQRHSRSIDMCVVRLDRNRAYRLGVRGSAARARQLASSLSRTP